METKRRILNAAGVATAVAALAGGGALTDSGGATPTRTQAKPAERVAPKLEGTFREGQTVTTTNGEWANAPTSFAYRWLRCSATATNCVPIAGATSKSYKLTAGDVDRRVQALVTASNRDGSTTANSPPSPVVESSSAPANTARPTISGTPRVGEELRANPGTWSGKPTRYEYQWLRCNAAGGDCATLAGAASQAYGVRSADVGSTLRVRVRAFNAQGGSAPVTSDRTELVRAGGTATASVGISEISLPNRLVISGVRFTPSVISDRFAPFTGRFRVTDSNGRAVSGALVYAIGVPAGRVAVEGEQPTDASGWATFTYRPLAGMPFKQGASVVFFVRARKAGENLLGGVSTRRLVQIRVSPR